VTRWDRLLHSLGFHSVERCPNEHTWKWDQGRWRAHGPSLLRAVPPSTPLVILPTAEMAPPSKLPDVPLEPPTTEIRAVTPPGRHRPAGEQIRPPSRPDPA
jgi:hypothetical protein